MQDFCRQKKWLTKKTTVDFSYDLGFKAGILGYSISEMKAHKK